MKHFPQNIIFVLMLTLLFLSCNKEEQSCHDGVFTPGSEEQTDCGGLCPPCDDGEEPVIEESVFAKVQGAGISFSNRDLIKNPDWIMSFQNDSVSVIINFGAGDSLGARPLKVQNSSANFQGVSHSTLAEGNVLFTEINNVDNRLSGFFECKFVSDQNVLDTLFVTNGDFQNISW